MPKNICCGGPSSTIDPVIHEDHAVGGVARKAHLVAYHQHGHAAALELAHDVEHAADEFRIERRGGLIEQHHLGFERERARDRDPLLLAARKLTGIGARLVGKAHPIERRDARCALPRRAACPAPWQRECDVPQRRHVRIEVERLEYHADLSPHGVDVGRARHDVDAVDANRTSGRLLQAGCSSAAACSCPIRTAR